ncbi:RHS repeat-associated core domain-containing protein, partial [Pseudomarimonas arenosa]
ERRTRYAYDAQNRLTSITTEADADTAAASTGYAYDAAGNITKITDAEAGETRFEDFDALGNARTRIDARGKRWTQTFDAAGNLLSQTDPLGRTTRYEYDAVGNRTKTIFPPAQLGETATEMAYHYDAANRLIRTVDALGGERSTAYDRAGNRIEEEDESDNKTRYSYDRFNRLSTISDGNNNVTRYVYPDLSADPSSGALTHAGDLYQPIAIEHMGSRVSFKFNNRDKIVVIGQSSGVLGGEPTVIRSEYDLNGNVVLTEDAKGARTRYEHDALGRVLRVIDAHGGVTHYGYDDRDNLLSLTDANNNTHRFSYDRLNRTRSEARPMGQTHRYAYDADGNLIEELDARSQTANYVYDDAGRRTTTQYTRAGESNPHKTVSFSYDDRNVLTGYDDGTTSGQYTYDELQRKTQEAVNYGDFTWTYRYSYYPNGQKASYTTIDGTTFSYGYDAAKNLASIVIPNEGTIEYSNYRGTRPGQVSYPDGTLRSLTYDGLLRSETIKVVNASQETLMDYRYTYDAVGNIAEKATEHGPYRYEYDRVDRLTAADYPNGSGNDQINDSMASNTFPFADDRYTYDPLGNRLTDQRQTPGFTWQYNANNELLHSGFATYQYNENGSTTAKLDPATGEPIQRYAYNSEERMSEVRDAEGNLVAEYYYDPFGRRLWKTLYPGAEGHPGGGQPVKEYLAYSEEGYAGRKLGRSELEVSDEIEIYLISPESQWWSSELIGSRVDEWNYFQLEHNDIPSVISAAGSFPASAARRATFGQSPESARMDFRFPGQLFDLETSLAFNFNRTYSADTARYFEVDPIGLTADINLYRYANGNPEFFVDATGEAAPLAAVALLCLRSPRLCAAILTCIRNIKACTKPMCKAMCKGYQVVCKAPFHRKETGGAGACDGTEGCYLSTLKCGHFGACCTMRGACNICAFGGMGHPDRHGNRTTRDQPTVEECGKAYKCCAQAASKCYDCYF